MGRKFIPAEVTLKQRKIFLDDLKKIHKRRVKTIPVIPRFEEIKSDDTTNCSSQVESHEMQF